MSDLGIIQDGGVLVRDGEICEVGTMRRLENLNAARGAREIDAKGKVVMPGFVDCHTHLIFPMPHSSEDRGQAARALVQVTAQRLAARGRIWLRSMARHGTTTLEAKTGCGPNVSAELKVLRVLGLLNRGALDIVPTFLWRPDPPEDGDFGGLLATIHRRRLARFADFESGGDGMERLLQQARDLRFPLKIQADGQPCDRAVEMAVRFGATSIDHLEYATSEHARALSATPAIAILLPCASFRSGHYAPARALLEAGVPLALGTNFNPAHTPSLNMQTAISLACLQLQMTPEEALTAATVNAAYALNAGLRAGSLEVNKLADIVILDTGDYRDLGSHLGTNLVHATIKRGEIVPPATAN